MLKRFRTNNIKITSFYQQCPYTLKLLLIFCGKMPGTDSVEALLVAEKIRRAVQQAGIEHSESAEGNVTVSVGASACSPTEEDLSKALIGTADKAPYMAKASGRNMSVIANDPLTEQQRSTRG